MQSYNPLLFSKCYLPYCWSLNLSLPHNLPPLYTTRPKRRADDSKQPTDEGSFSLQINSR